jgi:heterodisulfide reductase subunit A-like polyferredoxin
MAKEKAKGKKTHGKCVYCGRCAKMCERIGANAITQAAKGKHPEGTSPITIDANACVGCGACITVCPTEHMTVERVRSFNKDMRPLIPSEFNEGLAGRRPVYVPYAQAVPNKPGIDPGYCVHFVTGGCKICAENCPTCAITHDMSEEEIEIEAGAVIMATGYRPFDASGKPEYGYDLYPNVITSLEFERLLSAAGPCAGHVVRVSDGRDPKKIAWIQCVGSRDAANGKDYCSSVCCMYATKQAIISKEHDAEVEPTIFFIDVRAHGKGFDRYYERAKGEHGVRYVRSHVSKVTENPITHDVEIKYVDETGELREERFDMVVLSVGLSPHPSTEEAAAALGVELDRFGFAERRPFDLIATSRPGVYSCGTFQAPKDIPETVAQASSAAGEAHRLLAEARGTRVKEIEYPEERDTSGEEPRIGVFVCHCGINIAGVVDVKEVAAYAETLPNVVFATDLMFSCSTDSQEKMREVIKEQQLNRVVVASCSPRTHEPLFQDTIRKEGLNKYLFDMANIRDQCSWVHQKTPKDATAKAKDLVRMSVSRASLLEPLKEVPFDVTQKGLVIGGGVSGMTAALTLADQGFETTLVEKTETLGGEAGKLYFNAAGDDIQRYLKELIERVTSHQRVRVITSGQVVETQGHVGEFKTRVKTPAGFEEVDHGATIVTTGGQEYRPTEYLYGEHPGVLTQREFHGLLGTRDSQIRDAKNVVMIQCVGSREPEHPYCSRICCTQAVTNALELKKQNPEAEVYILFRDMRTFGMNELIYKQARESGVRFVRFDTDRKPEVVSGSRGLAVKVFDMNMRTELEIPVSHVVLSVAVRPNEGCKPLATTLKLPFDADGFFLEAHVKLRPLDFANQGYFLAGLGHSPKFLEESIAQAKGAASRAATILSKEKMFVGGAVAVVDREECVVCLTCARVCPFGVPKVAEDGVIRIDPAECQGCGVCAAACPRKLIQVQHMKDNQVIALETSIFPMEELINDLQKETA